VWRGSFSLSRQDSSLNRLLAPTGCELGCELPTHTLHSFNHAILLVVQLFYRVIPGFLTQFGVAADSKVETTGQL